MAVCAGLLIVVGVAIALLLYRGYPIPRHLFILDMLNKLSQAENDREGENSIQTRGGTAA